MKVYLAATSSLKEYWLNGQIQPDNLFILESFYSVKPWQVEFIPKYRSFLLDSGAFTFMHNKQKHGNIDWGKYAEVYGKFIKENGVRNYFELDIDVIVGLREVEKLRSKIEQISGVQSIPVFHLSRGKDYFINLCKDYHYIAFGGLVSDAKKANNLAKFFPWFIEQAHKYGTKIHGLGYTNIKNLSKIHFDSVDSTTWLMGSKYGEVFRFEKGKMVRFTSVRNGVKERKLINVKETDYHNFKEWVKFQNYAYQNL